MKPISTIFVIMLLSIGLQAKHIPGHIDERERRQFFGAQNAFNLQNNQFGVRPVVDNSVVPVDRVPVLVQQHLTHGAHHSNAFTTGSTQQTHFHGLTERTNHGFVNQVSTVSGQTGFGGEQGRLFSQANSRVGSQFGVPSRAHVMQVENQFGNVQGLNGQSTVERAGSRLGEKLATLQVRPTVQNQFAFAGDANTFNRVAQTGGVVVNQQEPTLVNVQNGVQKVTLVSQIVGDKVLVENKRIPIVAGSVQGENIVTQGVSQGIVSNSNQKFISENTRKVNVNTHKQSVNSGFEQTDASVVNVVSNRNQELVNRKNANVQASIAQINNVGVVGSQVDSVSQGVVSGNTRKVVKVQQGTTAQVSNIGVVGSQGVVSENVGNRILVENGRVSQVVGNVQGEKIFSQGFESNRNSQGVVSGNIRKVVKVQQGTTEQVNNGFESSVNSGVVGSQVESVQGVASNRNQQFVNRKTVNSQINTGLESSDAQVDESRAQFVSGQSVAQSKVIKNNVHQQTASVVSSGSRVSQESNVLSDQRVVNKQLSEASSVDSQNGREFTQSGVETQFTNSGSQFVSGQSVSHKKFANKSRKQFNAGIESSQSSGIETNSNVNSVVSEAQSGVVSGQSANQVFKNKAINVVSGSQGVFNTNPQNFFEKATKTDADFNQGSSVSLQTSLVGSNAQTKSASFGQKLAVKKTSNPATFFSEVSPVGFAKLDTKNFF